MGQATGRRPLDLLAYVDQATRLGQAERQEVGYVARLFAQTALPYQDPGDVPGWQRRNGGLSLVIQPGVTGHPDGTTTSTGYPYGVIPRLLLAYVTSEALRTDQRVVQLGSSLRDFCRRLGLDDSGPAMGRLKDQARRLFQARITATYVAHHGDGLSQERFTQMTFATSYEMWHSTRNPDQAALFDNYVQLSPEFFEEATRRPVPLDMGVLRLIKASPMRLDIYAWLTHRMSYLRDESLVTWEQIQAQFGSAATSRPGRYKFRSDFEKNLLMVKAAYPGARATVVPNGVLLQRGRTSVTRKDPAKSTVPRAI